MKVSLPNEANVSLSNQTLDSFRSILHEYDTCPVNQTLTPSLRTDPLLESYLTIGMVYVIVWIGVTLLISCLKAFKKMWDEGFEPVEIVVFDYNRMANPKRSKTCGPVFFSGQEKKPLEHLSAEDLQEIAGTDDDVEQETVTEYCYGGYKPIEIGEEIVNRYTVIRKLGFGHFSTVWLCKDRNDPDNIQFVAVKIVKAADMFNNVAQDEIKLLRAIMSADPSHEGSNHIIQMVDFFQTRSINGHHTCLVFELMGPSLLYLLSQSDYCGIDLRGVRNILKQILMGLAYLHNVCRILHTDIKPENILIKVKESYIRKMVDTSTRYNELGVQMPRSYVSAETWENYLYVRDTSDYSATPGPSSECDTPSRSSSFPKDDVDVKSTSERHDNIRELHRPLFVSPNIEVKIADLGNGCWEDRHFSTNIQTKQYRALEVILGADYNFPADMWSLGCMAFELATGEFLFNPKRTQNITSAQDHILLVCEVLGGIPKYIAQRGYNSHEFFDAAGNLKIHSERDVSLRIWKTEDVLVEKYKWKRVDAIPFAAFVESMIEPDPELRLTAESALNYSWFDE